MTFPLKLKYSSLCLLAFLLIFSTSSYAQKISKKERKIVAQVEKNNLDAIKFLETVVNVNSGTMNPQGVRETGRLYDNALSEIGFTTEWIDMPTEMNRAGHLFATINGDTGKRILLIGHLDTVFEEHSEFQKFEPVNDSVAKGPGANDMKGGDVIILYALKALREAGLLDDAQITVALNGDEESAGKPISISRKPLVDAAKRSDVALCFETSTGYDKATVARRGSSGWKVEVTGKRAHSSGIFNEYTGAGANFELARILYQFYTEVKGEDLLTFNPGMMLGGTTLNIDAEKSRGEVFGKSNVVAQTAYADGGLRFISEEQKERARNKMREIVANNLPQTSAKITFTDSYPAMGPTDANYELLHKLDQVSQDLGQPAVEAYDPGKRGAADISFVAQYLACLDGLGTMGRGAHTPAETVNLNTIEALTKRTAILIYRLINEKRPQS
ncbi:M20/M25/M40 family metallo-hydrolase [Leeuwenhoekiella sp. A16]|uniref:M20/M25/M40 family metallo-hydrolase n=1 Tax=unclassified Leeuwenhoekiella TaxID=2615029 RepID=UPI003A80D886